MVVPAPPTGSGSKKTFDLVIGFSVLIRHSVQ
jgi:hypothetical protein